jgi:osmotically-inducible protein OsmY
MVATAPKDASGLSYPYGQVEPSGQVSGDEQVLSGVLNALHHNTGVPQDQVQVKVQGGHAVLTGVVAEAFQRELAEQTVATAPGVIDVTNQITLED